MPTFKYKAVTEAGSVLEGEMEARNQSAVIERLHDLGHLPVRAEEIKASGQGNFLQRDLFGSRRASSKDIAALTRDLATLLQSGLSLVRSLDMLVELNESAAVTKLLADVLESVRGGSSLADAMAAQNNAFPQYYVSMVRAGESGGSLDGVLERLAGFMQRSQEMIETVKSALIYPMILFAMAAASVVILLTVVVPEFKPLFEDAGESLPFATQIIISIGDAFERYWWLMLLAFVGAVMLFRQQLSTPAGRFRWDSLVLKMPLFGDLVTKIEVARFSRTVGTLLHNGVTLPTALGIVRDTLRNTVIAKAVEDAATLLKEGQGLADPLVAAEIFPSLATHLVRVGEESGKLEEMLIRVADIYEREIQHSIDRMLALLVPLLTITLGVLIAGIIGSVLVAILSVNQLAF